MQESREFEGLKVAELRLVLGILIRALRQCRFVLDELTNCRRDNSSHYWFLRCVSTTARSVHERSSVTPPLVTGAVLQSRISFGVTKHVPLSEVLAMASGFVHEVQTLIALGRSYPHIHQRKDGPARYRPGLAHRRVRHNWYQSHGTLWHVDNPGSDVALKRLDRVRRVLGPDKADEYIASLAHDQLDVIWDYSELSHSERKFARKYWEAFHVWIVLRPGLLKTWGGVDVLSGRIQRIVDDVEVWENDPEVKREYARLLRRAQVLARRDRGIAFMLKTYGQEPAESALTKESTAAGTSEASRYTLVAPDRIVRDRLGASRVRSLRSPLSRP